MIWLCLHLYKFWSTVIDYIIPMYTVMVTLTWEPLLCVLGDTADLIINEYENIAIGRLLYVERKLLVLHWLSNVPQPV